MSKVTTILEFEAQTEKTLEYLRKRIAPLRLGRIQLSLLENVQIDYFGSPSSVKFRVNASKQNDGSYLLTPFLKSELKIIYEALIDARLAWTISTQGDSIRVTAPLPTSEAKRKTEKQIENYVEEGRIRIRQLRHDLLQVWKNEFDPKSDQKQRLESELKRKKEEMEKKIEDLKKEEIELLNRV